MYLLSEALSAMANLSEMNVLLVYRKVTTYAIWLLSGLVMANAQVHEAEFHEKIEPLLQDYCYDCHGDGSAKGDFSLDGFTNLTSHLQDHDLWQRVWSNVRTELMPPSDKRSQPAPEERRELIAWIERRVFRLDPENPDPGRVTIRRMNSVEYRNTIHDLLGVDFQVDDNFPPDDTGFGFDTIGDVLTISPLLMEKYLAAASEIAERCLPDDAGLPKPIEVDGSNFRGGRQSGRFMEANIKHTIGVKKRLDIAGRYNLGFSYSINSEGGHPEGQTATWRFLVDGEEQHRYELDSAKFERKTFEVELDLTQGEHRFECAIVPGEPGEGNGSAGVIVDKLLIEQSGVVGTWEMYPDSYKRIFFKGLPGNSEAERAAYMREIIERFARLAFRRPVDTDTVDRLSALGLAKAGPDKANFVDGVKLALAATLTSPRFLFRSEAQAEPNNPSRVVPLDEYALASRLSYFLWSSAPNEELLELAEKGLLRERLRAQVDHMLADQKAERLVTNFVGQWLQTRDLMNLDIDVRTILKERSRRNAERVFNDGIRRDLKSETERFFRYVLVENRPVLELLNADYSFLNENLANFYKVPDVKGREFRKVTFDEKVLGRGGLLGQGAFLVLTSHPTRTSPVNRGLFVLENFLGTPTPAAPPDVPELGDAKEKLDEGATMRQLMESHRAQALCMSCHRRMDPIGLALENFNAIGQWRDRADGNEIDSAGELVTGEGFSNVMELKSILATSRKQDFYRCLTEKMLTYALGRGVEYYDTLAINAIVSRLNQNQGRMRDLIYGIIESPPFQMRRGDGKRLLNKGPNTPSNKDSTQLD